MREQPSFPRGSCRGYPVEWWFPDVGVSQRLLARTKSICYECPERPPCAEWGIANEHYGVWGGLTENDRIKIRRRRGLGKVYPPEYAARKYQHGTNGGYFAHLRVGERACGACREAHTRYQADYEIRRRVG